MILSNGCFLPPRFWVSQRPGMPPKYRVRVTTDEFEWFKSVGLTRHNNAIEQGKKEAHGHMAELSEGDHVVGCGGEFSQSLFYQIIWLATVNHYKDVDIPTHWTHVRTRNDESYGIMHRWVDPCDGYWCCWTVSPDGRIYTLHGYVLGAEFRNIGTYGPLARGREDVWTVDQHLLRDAADLLQKPLPKPPVGQPMPLAANYPFQNKV